jgi:hypothetical protein
MRSTNIVDERRYGSGVYGQPSLLGIDFGTTHTVAALAVQGARVQQLLFDSGPLLSSAVYGDEDKPLLVGRDAQRGSRVDPTRFEPNPKRRIDDGTVLLGTREYPVAEIIAAVLRRVADEAGRVGGGSPGATVITYPANWATTRRGVLADAARRAGLGSLTLVPEPVAAAAYFTTALGRPVPPGAGLVVYDFGAGTFDTSVLRRRPDQAWEVLASDGVDVGGLDLDAALVDLVGEAMAARDPALWRRLRESDEESVRRLRHALFEDARAAKEQLSRAPSAAVHVPLFDTEVHVTREQFEALARPWLARTVDLTAAMLARTGLGPGQLAGLFLVGGSSRIPLVGTMLHQRLGIAPTVIEQPELVVALGSLEALPGGRPAAAPVSAAPISATPVSPLAPPPPVPLAAASGPPQPLWPDPPGTRVVDTPRRRARPRLGAALAAVAVLVAAAGGVAGYQLLGDESDKDGNGNGNTSSNNTGPNPGSSIVVGAKPNENADPGAPQQTVKVDKTVWYGGQKITFGTLTYDESKDPPLRLDARIENLTRRPVHPTSVDLVLKVDEQNYEGTPEGYDPVPGLATGTNTFIFRPQKAPQQLSIGVLTVGRADTVQAVIPLGGDGELITLEPRTVMTNKTVSVGALTMTVAKCELRADNLENSYQVKTDQRHVYCRIDVKYHGASGRPGGQNINDLNFRLRLPDNTVEAPEPGTSDLLNPDEVMKDEALVFTIKWPAPGAYGLQLLDLGWLNHDPPTSKNTKEIPLTIA